MNFVTCHDGFTLRDLVSYDRKHNEANLEGNRDGTDDNRSWNCGVEGETDDPEVNELRDRQIRNFLATLLLSQGTPMLLAGDEIRRTQQGNNNAYCQDNELSWVDWELDERAHGLLEFTRRLLRLRAEHPVFRRSAFLTGDEHHGLRRAGRLVVPARRAADEPADWAHGDAFALGAFLNGAEIPSQTADGEPITDDSFIVLFNAWREPVTFVLPPTRFGRRWAHELCTAEPDLPPNGTCSALGMRCRSPSARSACCAASASAAQSAAGGGCFSTRRQTSTTTGSNCVPAALVAAERLRPRGAPPR